MQYMCVYIYIYAKAHVKGTKSACRKMRRHVTTLQTMVWVIIVPSFHGGGIVFGVTAARQ